MKEFHLYLNETAFKAVTANAIHTLAAIEHAVENNEIIHTANVLACTTSLITKHGYRIFLHGDNGKMLEITLGRCAGTSRELRPEHNLPNLIAADEFEMTK